MKAITTKFRPVTEAHGSCIAARCEAGSIRVPYDHGLSADGNHDRAARKLAEKFGWRGRPMGGTLPDGRTRAYVFVVPADVVVVK